MQNKLIKNSKQSLNFHKTFPELFTYFEEFKKLGTECPKILSNFLNTKRANEINDIIRQILGKYWINLETINNYVCLHIIKMLFCVYIDPVYDNFTENDQSILLWSVIFHDIVKKRFQPQKKQDRYHPFRSAEQTLRFFKENDFFEDSEENKIDRLIYLVQNSKKIGLDTKNNIQTELIDYGHINEIFILSKQLLKSKFSHTVFTGVAFHQSTQLAQFYYASKIDVKYLNQIYTKENFEIMKALQINDSMSHIKEQKLKPIIRMQFQESFQEIKNSLNIKDQIY